MSKKVLILSSSFRKGGNSDTLCDQFAMGARDAGHAVEKSFLTTSTSAIAGAAAFATRRTNAFRKTTWQKYSTKWLKPMLL